MVVAVREKGTLGEGYRGILYSELVRSERRRKPQEKCQGRENPWGEFAAKDKY